MARATLYGRIGLVLTALSFCVLVGFQFRVDATPGKKVKLGSIKGVVTDDFNRPIKGAMVYLIDSTMIDTTPITQPGIIAGTTEGYDEPLEDIVNNPDKVKLLPQGKTNAKGLFNVKKVNEDTNYFAFAVPAADDTDHLPGGSISRNAFSPKSLTKAGLKIALSWNTPSAATYIGSSACYGCHTDVNSNKHTGHALMYWKFQDTANQDSANHPGAAWGELAGKFTLATAYNKPVSGTKVETLYFQEYLATSNAASNGVTYRICENTPGLDPNGVQYAIDLTAYLWKDASNNYYCTLQNAKDASLMTLNVVGTMGGYIRQRLLVKVPGYNGLYPFITYQDITGSASQGNSKNYDRSRGNFHTGTPGGGGIATFFNSTTKAFVAKPSGNNGPGCGSCHTAAGAWRSYKDATTGETLAHTVADPNGVFDIDNDGVADEVGIGCEQCHGPGSAHRDSVTAARAAAASAPASKTKKTATVDNGAKYIVNPSLLCADRASVICGRCHGGGGIKDSSNAFPPVGISRAQYLTYLTNKGTPPLNPHGGTPMFWPDQEFERGGHEGFAYGNWLESKHMRNSRQLVGCDDCHDAMGDSQYRYMLKGDPDNSETGLCNTCHTQDVSAHVLEKTGSVMSGSRLLCITCHMPRVGKGGAGRPGMMLGTPTGAQTDANIEYWENDQSAHNWEVPNKFDAGVAGQVPGNAMPVPYTNSCGNCHDVSNLQYQAPR